MWSSQYLNQPSLQTCYIYWIRLILEDQSMHDFNFKPCTGCKAIFSLSAVPYFRMLLKHCFEQLRSTQVAVVHCSAQTNPTHVLQKLSQSCMVLNTNTGRVYRPKDCERLVLYLKDLNLPKPDKWGTCQLVAFLQQVLIWEMLNFFGTETCLFLGFNFLI